MISPRRPWKKWTAALPCGVLAGFLSLTPAEAVEDLATGTFNTSAPTSTNIANWATGWPASGISGWNYVGNVGGAGGVYVGNGWVLTVAHVGAGTFTLAGVGYAVVPGSEHSFTDAYGTADITLFQIYSPPSLPSLTIATSAPTPLSTSSNGNQVAMIGYGGGSESWGLNTVTAINIVAGVESFETIDFETLYGTTTDGSHSATNNYCLISGDSGGGDFIYNSSTSKWQLAGLNEAVDANNDSYFVQLSSFASQINPLISPASAPGVTTAAATSITETGAVLNGTVNAHGLSTSTSFDYGTTTGYGTNVAATPATVTGTGATAVTVTLSGLSPGTTYHFRVDGVNSDGTSNGGDVTFTTLPTAVQSWRQTYYGTTSDSGNAADTADPYDTGVPNLLVFGLLGPNQNPALAMLSQLPQAQLSGGNLSFNFTQPTGVSGLTYGAQWSATLQPTDWHAITDTGSGSQHVFSVPVGSNTALYIRLTITDPGP